MEHESFEDSEVAAFLNEHYVSIKVDREERPDVDHIYMAVCQAMTGAGGWPLSVFMSPEQLPFFSGTYFPKTDRFGKPGFLRVLSALQAAWRDERTKVMTIGEDTPIEEAAREMIDNKIGGLPVLRDGKVVGIITETDIFKIMLEMLGARQKAVRVSVLVPNVAGEIASLSKAIFELGGNIIALGTFSGDDPSTSELVFKVDGPDEATLKAALEPRSLEVRDIRTC